MDSDLSVRLSLSLPVYASVSLSVSLFTPSLCLQPIVCNFYPSLCTVCFFFFVVCLSGVSVSLSSYVCLCVYLCLSMSLIWHSLPQSVCFTHLQCVFSLSLFFCSLSLQTYSCLCNFSLVCFSNMFLRLSGFSSLYLYLYILSLLQAIILVHSRLLFNHTDTLSPSSPTSPCMPWPGCCSISSLMKIRPSPITSGPSTFPSSE